MTLMQNKGEVGAKLTAEANKRAEGDEKTPL